MALTLFDLGAEDILKSYFGTSDPPAGFKLMLYTSPSGSLTDSTVLVEAAGSSYARQAVDTSDCTMTPTAAYPGGIAEMVWADKTFDLNGPLTGNPAIQGYALIKSTAGATHALSDVIFAEPFPAPFTPANTGDKQTVKLKFRLGNGIPQ